MYVLLIPFWNVQVRGGCPEVTFDAFLDIWSLLKYDNYPIGSMYGLFTYIYHKNQLNVGKFIPYMDPVGMGWFKIDTVDISEIPFPTTWM